MLGVSFGPTGAGSNWTAVGTVLEPNAGFTGIKVGTLEVTGTSILTGNVTVSSTISLAAGAVGAPSMRFTLETTTGLWRPGAGSLSVAVLGAEVARFVAGGLDVGTAAVQGGAAFGAADAFLARTAAATWQLGGANAAAPVAQTLRSQGSRAGTDANVGGANLTIASGLGTGTGTASSIVFGTPDTTGAGSGAQALATRLTLNASGATFTVSVLAPAGTAGAPGIAFSASSGCGIYRQAADVMGFVNGGSTETLRMSANVLDLGPNSVMRWGSALGTGDSDVLREAAGVLAQRSGTQAQELRQYARYDGATDYHRLALRSASTTLSGLTGASVTATGLIPDGAVLVGVTSKILTTIGNSSGTTGFQLGTAVDADRFANAAGVLTAGSVTQNADWTAGGISMSIGATDVIVTALGGVFDGTGSIRIVVYYLIAEAD